MQSHDAAPCEIALLQHGGKATIIPQGHTNPEAIRPVTATRWGLGRFLCEIRATDPSRILRDYDRSDM